MKKINTIILSAIGVFFFCLLLYIGMAWYLGTHLLEEKNSPSGFLFIDAKEQPTKRFAFDTEWATNEETKKEIEKYWDIKSFSCKDANGNNYPPRTIKYYGISDIYKFFPMVAWTGGAQRSAFVCKDKYFIGDFSGHEAPTLHGPFDTPK